MPVWLALALLLAVGLSGPAEAADARDIEIEWVDHRTVFFGSPGETHKRTVRVANLGTQNEAIQMSATSVPGGWTVDLSPGTFSVSAGEARNVLVTLTPGERPVTGTMHLRASALGTGGDTDTTPTPLALVVPIIVTIELEKDRYLPTEDVRGVVRLAFRDGSGLSAQPVEVLNHPDMSLFRQSLVRDVTDNNGTFPFTFPSNPLGATGPGGHTVTAIAPYGGFNWQDRAEYTIGP